MEYYSEIDEYHEFSLNCLDQFFKSYQPPAGGAELLEFGGGGVVSNLISSVPRCKGVVYGEFSKDNREAINRWLMKDLSQPLTGSHSSGTVKYHGVACALLGSSETSSLANLSHEGMKCY